jgi:hypothetical protein
VGDRVFCILSSALFTSVKRSGWLFALMILRSFLMNPGLLQMSLLFAADCLLAKETTNCDLVYDRTPEVSGVNDYQSPVERLLRINRHIAKLMSCRP